MNNSSAPSKDISQLRKTTQYLMPNKLDDFNDGEVYNIYPVTKLDDGKIFNGYTSLAKWIIAQKTVVIDGYVGVLWDLTQEALKKELEWAALKVNFIETAKYLKPEVEIEKLVHPFLGTPTSVWGTKCTLDLKDLYAIGQLTTQQPDDNYDINIIIGTGATLAGWNAPIIYIDVPKNEIQFRMRAGSVNNLGSSRLIEPAQMYKRFYFVDWVLCSAHKKAILPKIAIVADGQWGTDINWEVF